MERTKNIWLILIFFVSILTIPSQAFCTIVQWTSGTGANGHYYEWVSRTGDWTGLFTNTPFTTGNGEIDLTSNDGALTGGYLATITSAEENAFILNNFGTSFESLAFLGGRDSNYSTSSVSIASAIWYWETGLETGQSFYNETAGASNNAYTNWATGQPSDLNIHYLAMSLNTGTWYDTNNSGSSGGWGSVHVTGYIAEYAAPVPEPATILLLWTGLLGLTAVGRRKMDQS